jgi:hypothetical protein
VADEVIPLPALESIRAAWAGVNADTSDDPVAGGG